MTKLVAMIPVRMGSKRVPKKNIRMLNGKPLVAYIIEAAKASNLFGDEIYLNSEDDLFAEIAKDYGVKFYKRPAELAADITTNDEFVYDFLQNVKCHTVIQLLATSPFISAKNIRDFVTEMQNEEIDTLISVKKTQIESLCMGEVLNFNPTEHTQPSQTLAPVISYACSMMGWNSEMFIHNYMCEQGAYHGGYGTTKHFELRGYATVDIDTEQDFLLAEKIAEAILSKFIVISPQYYNPDKKILSVEKDVPNILVKDGIKNVNVHDANKEVVNIKDIINQHGFFVDVMKQSWSDRIIDTESNSATLICQMPNEGNRRHYHHSWNEWWYIVRGQWRFELEDKIKLVREGDIVFIPKNKVHKITAVGDEPAIRLAVSRADVEHVYV